MAGRLRAARFRRTTGALVSAALLAFLAVVVGAAPASAHAALLKTDPSEGQVLAKAPDRATLTFDEHVRLHSGGVHLFYADGSELRAQAHTSDNVLVVDLPGSMKSGTYIVAWRIISTDGHPVAGALTFSIGKPSARVATPKVAATSTPASVNLALAVVQALVYLALFLTVGLTAFAMLLLPWVDGLQDVREQIGRLARAAAWTCLGAVVVQFPVNSVYQSGDGLLDALRPSHWSLRPGSAESWAALAVIVGLLACVRAPRREHGPTPVALAGCALALASLALVGHTRSYGPLPLVVASDVTHVLAGAVWFGGLVGLVLSLPRLSARPRIAADTLARFSTLAAGTLALVALTGTLLAWRILGSWQALVDSSFGITLLVKVSLVGIVALVAAANRYRLLPAVLADSGHDSRRAAASRLRSAVRLEAGILVAVLVVTGVLVDRSPVDVDESGAVAAPGGLDANTSTGQAGGVKVVVRLSPMSVGANTMLVQLQSADGDPLEPYGAPVVSFSHGSLDLGNRPLSNVDSGTYRGRVVLPRRGTWTASVTVRTGEFASRVVPVSFTIR